MTIQRLSSDQSGFLQNPGVVSAQLVWAENAPEAKMTITRVTMQPGSTQARHAHEKAEQIWLIEQGMATLLLENDETAPLQQGDIIRTPAGDVHGISNAGSEIFVYLAITTPPQDFRDAYDGAR